MDEVLGHIYIRMAVDGVFGHIYTKNQLKIKTGSLTFHAITILYFSSA